jgi:hypothetical protein
MKEALSSSETSVLTRATWHNIPEDANVYTTYEHPTVVLLVTRNCVILELSSHDHTIFLHTSMEKDSTLEDFIEL